MFLSFKLIIAKVVYFFLIRGPNISKGVKIKRVLKTLKLYLMQHFDFSCSGKNLWYKINIIVVNIYHIAQHC